MRTDTLSERLERRESIDYRLVDLLFQCGFTPILINNNIELCKQVTLSLPFCALVLGGGGDVSYVSNEITPRDIVEEFLIDWAVLQQIPILGICRGMQSLATRFGGELEKIKGHVGIRHQLAHSTEEVNSYHNYAISVLPESFEPLNYAHDGILESFKSEKNKALGIMWHPEREPEFKKTDMLLITNHLLGEN